jgi:hypothetical protein
MKLYLWGRVLALAEYTPGMAFALAKTKERAIELIVARRENYSGLEDRKAKLRQELEMTEPEIIENEYGHYETGSA